MRIKELEKMLREIHEKVPYLTEGSRTMRRIKEVLDNE
jgi:hypothetical protein